MLFAPTFGHFVGGQTAVFGMLGLWGYRKYISTSSLTGGIFLGLALLKPQLGIIPLAFALTQWRRDFKAHKTIPRQVWAWLITLACIYLPGFLFVPDWPVRWLSNPRPLFERAMSGFAPRTLLYFVSPSTLVYWSILVIVGSLLLWNVWRLNHKSITLDAAVLWSFIVSPLVHDYDLIQLIPLLEKPIITLAAVLCSLPGWLVILFAYSNDFAWYAFTIVAPAILGAWLYHNRRAVARSSHV